MLKFLSKLKWWKPTTVEDTNYVVYDYGRYLYKPVMQRTLSEVMGITQTELVRMVGSEKIYLNGEVVDITALVKRLESGRYKVRSPSLKRIWHFYIV